MDERTALAATGLEAFETAQPRSPNWTDADRAWADRVALDAAPAGAPLEAFVGARARHALQRLAPREPALARLQGPSLRRGALDGPGDRRRLRRRPARRRSGRLAATSTCWRRRCGACSPGTSSSTSGWWSGRWCSSAAATATIAGRSCAAWPSASAAASACRGCTAGSSAAALAPLRRAVAGAQPRPGDAARRDAAARRRRRARARPDRRALPARPGVRLPRRLAEHLPHARGRARHRLDRAGAGVAALGHRPARRRRVRGDARGRRPGRRRRARPRRGSTCWR